MSLNGAKNIGFVLKERFGTSPITSIIDDNNIELTVQVRMIFEFDSDRKAQSVVVMYNEKIYLLIKGADNSIMNRTKDLDSTPHIDKIKKFLKLSSVKGLRTLCFAYKEISKSEFEQLY